MKKTVYVFILLFLAVFTNAQQVDRQMVVLEISTGT